VTGLAQGAFTATVVAIAEATGDSVANISGTVVDCPTLGVVATDHDFGNVLVTRTAAGTVQVINTGEAEVTVRSMRIVDDVEGSFRVLGPATPLAIAPGAAVTVDVDFTPGSVGAKSARVEYETTAGIVHSRLTGTGVVLVIPAHIPRTYHGEPGDERRVAVVLDSSIAVAASVPIPVVVEYDADLLDFVALHDTAAAQAALRLVASEPGRVSLELVPHGDSLFAGPVAALRFLVRITLADSSELPLSMTSPMPWLSFVTSPGLFVRDPWCGLAERLFEFTSGTLVLRPVQPNPVRSEARIEFGVPLDGDATLVVVDALGAERLRLIDGHLAAGTYAATIPSGTLDAGVYLVRLASSGMQLVERFVVE
jgi:hypothetical protein